MRKTRRALPFLLPLIFATSVAAAQFPPGTLTFFDTHAAVVIPASGGGVWVGTSQGLVRYTEAGAGTILPTPGGRPWSLVMAADGSIWFASVAGIARISTGGVILEQYPISNVGDLAVASDGALWYARDSLGAIVGRIAGGVPTEFPSPTQAWSLAPASGGDMWVLGNGFGTGTDDLYRMTSTGAVTVLPLGHDVLFGELQALPDGTLYIGTGIHQSVLRLPPGAQTVEEVSFPGSFTYLSDSSGNLWFGFIESLGYISRSGVPTFSAPMPGDPRTCRNTAAYGYYPLAIDSTGGLWVGIQDDAAYIPLPPPCNEPAPPPVPDLIRIDAAQFIGVNSHVPGHDVPAVSPAMLIALAIALAAGTLWRLRA